MVVGLDLGGLFQPRELCVSMMLSICPSFPQSWAGFPGTGRSKRLKKKTLSPPLKRLQQKAKTQGSVLGWKRTKGLLVPFPYPPLISLQSRHG